MSPGRFGRAAAPWRWLAILASLALLAWVLREVDWESFADVIATADIRPLLLLPFVAIGEQLVRAVKWRYMLHPVCRVGVWRLFGAIMAGYFANFVVPARVSPLVRAWLIARLENQPVGTVLATVALDRLVDGLVFVPFAVAAALTVSFPVQTERVEVGLLWAAAASLLAFVVLLLGLVAVRRRADRLAEAVARWLPARAASPVSAFVRRFADGVVWPDEAWRRGAIVFASIVMKLIAVSWFVLAGLAFGIVLTPMDYVFLMVFLGFLIVLAGTLGLVGGFTAGAVFALGGFGVPAETALAMTLAVQTTTLVTVTAAGLGALWKQGIRLSDLPARRAAAEVPGDKVRDAEAPGDEA